MKSTRPPFIGSVVGRSLVETLGSDCAAAAALALHFEAGGRSISHATSLGGLPSSAIDRAAKDFAERGWLDQSANGWTRSASHLPLGLADFLSGAAAMQTLMVSAVEAVAVVTLPVAPCAIGRALPTEGPIHASMGRTDDEIGRIARAAVTSITIMSPFVNREGAEFALRMFKESTAKRKTLITRMSGPTRHALLPMLPEMAENGIKVLNYRLVVEGGYETFHAKVVIADGDLAYVGSANLTHYARHSMELGIIVKGRAARAVSALVRSVERISHPVAH